MSTQGRSNKKWWVLLPVLALAFWLAIFGDKTPVQSAVQPVAQASKQIRVEIQAPQAVQQAASSTQTMSASAMLQLIPRSKLIPMDQRQAKSSRDLFSDRSWTPVPRPSAPVAAPPPMAPPVPFTYIGKRLEGERWQVFLARADQTFVVSVGSTIDNLYRIDAVTPPNLNLTYLPLGQTQSISIGEAK